MGGGKRYDEHVASVRQHLANLVAHRGTPLLPLRVPAIGLGPAAGIVGLGARGDSYYECAPQPLAPRPLAPLPHSHIALPPAPLPPSRRPRPSQPARQRPPQTCSKMLFSLARGTGGRAWALRGGGRRRSARSRRRWSCRTGGAERSSATAASCWSFRRCVVASTTRLPRWTISCASCLARSRWDCWPASSRADEATVGWRRRSWRLALRPSQHAAIWRAAMGRACLANRGGHVAGAAR